jgi:hypothetical protein
VKGDRGIPGRPGIEVSYNRFIQKRSVIILLIKWKVFNSIQLASEDAVLRSGEKSDTLKLCLFLLYHKVVDNLKINKMMFCTGYTGGQKCIC